MSRSEMFSKKIIKVPHIFFFFLSQTIFKFLFEKLGSMFLDKFPIASGILREYVIEIIFFGGFLQ